MKRFLVLWRLVSISAMVAIGAVLLFYKEPLF
jgi:hypothetical protein